MILLYSLTIFVGAALLFAVQPMFGRLVLPQLGGAPAVWNTSLVFFQATLLAGYAYAHLVSRRLPPARQVLVHGAVLLVALVSLPIALPAAWTPPTQSNPIPWLLVLAVVTVGLPFFALSATSPLLQQWLSLTHHPAARDPYFLYAASNLGSLIALLGYPLLIEPRLGLAQQSRWWTAGYGLLIALLLACAGTVWHRQPERQPDADDGVPATGPDAGIPWPRRLRWVVLALVPSSLMLSVTSYISTDLAAVPLLWVIPLAIYLGTFSLAFARRQLLPAAGLDRLFRLMLVLVTITLAMQVNAPLGLLIPLHLLGLFAVGLMCHRELAADRPPARQLTEFYLWLALGGVLGGAFTALVAPLVFRSVLEYPLGLLLACLLVPRAAATDESPARRRRDWLWPAGLLLVSLLLMMGVNRLSALVGAVVAQRLVIAVPALVCYSFARHRVRYALGLVVVLVVGGLQEHHDRRLLRAERTFFGIHRVVADADGEYHRLQHGTTVHGAQRRDPARRRDPVLYYARSGPVGQLMTALGERRQAVALVGLGTGGLLCYAEAGHHWTYYEIDPAVERIARDPELFTYLQDCPATVDVVLGDARLTLRAALAAQYRMIVLDAYNSDAIPLHLITREAVQLYQQKLQPDGVLAWHITNRHMDLEPVLAALARDAGWVCLVQHESYVAPAETAAGKAPSQWAVMARNDAALGPLADDPHWPPAREEKGLRVWTDDYADLFRVLTW